MRRRSPSGTPHSGACSSGSRTEACSAPWTERVAELGAQLVEARQRDGRRCSSRVSATRLDELGLAGGTLAYDATPPTAAALEARLDADIARGATRARPASRRRRDRGGRPRSAGVRLPGRAAARPALAAPRRGRAAARRRPLLLLDDVLSELDARRSRVLAERVAGLEQVVITATQRSALPARAEPGRGGDSWTGCLTPSAASSSRFGPQGALGEIAERWPEAVGEAIARNAWPSRIARDGTLHVNTADSIWAFELAQQASRDRRAARRRQRCGSRPARLPARTEPPAAGRVPLPSAEQARAAAEIAARDRGRDPARKGAKSGQFGARERVSGPTRLIHCRQPAKPLFCRVFGFAGLFSYGDEHPRGVVLRKGHHGPRRDRARPAPAGHVHRLDRLRRPPPPRLGGRRQRRRRGAERAQRRGRGDAPPGQLGHRRRPRPRDPGRRRRGPGPARADGGPDEAERRRQVRRRGLQGLGRPARRRRLGRERALRLARRRGAPRREGLPPGVRARRPGGRHDHRRRLRNGRDRHDDLVHARRRYLRGDRVVPRHAAPAPARDGLPDARAADHAHRRARGRVERGVPLRGRDPGLRPPHQRREGPDPPDDRLLRGRGRGARRLGRGRDAVEREVRRIGLLLREQHQHPSRRNAPLGLHGRPDDDDQQVRPRGRPAQGEGGQPRGRGHARGPRGRHLGEGARPAVRGPDQDQARQPLDPRLRPAVRQPEARGVPEREPGRPQADHQQGDRRRAGRARRRARRARSAGRAR